MIKAPTVEVQEALGTQRPGISLLDSHPASAPGPKNISPRLRCRSLRSPSMSQSLYSACIEFMFASKRTAPAPFAGVFRASSPGSGCAWQNEVLQVLNHPPSSAKLSAGCGHVASGGRSGTSPGAQFKTAVHMDTVQNRRIA